MTGTRERTAMLNGHEFSYLDSGDGPALLFIHGLTGSQRNWAHLIDALNHDHRVLAPDLFGHGASAKVMGDYSLRAHAATLRDLLDLLGIDRVTLVGHSSGAGVAMQFFYLFPEKGWSAWSWSPAEAWDETSVRCSARPRCTAPNGSFR